MTESKTTENTNPDILKKRYIDAYDLMISNLLDKDPPIRVEAIRNDCLDELMDIRDDILHQMQSERAIIDRMNPVQLRNWLFEEDLGTPCNVEN